MIVSSFRAEMFKIVRRRAVWINVILLLVMAVCLGYVLPYVLASFPPPTPKGAPPIDYKAAKALLYPANIVKSTAGTFSSIGVFALILGVLLQGSEYAWGTVKTMYTQGPGRLVMLAGKLGAVLATTLLMVVALFTVDTLASLVVVTVDAKSIVFPAASDVLAGLGGTWLILGFSAIFGFALATLFRESAMAIGLSITYSVIVEGLIFGLLGKVDFISTVKLWFPFQNIGYLSEAMGAAATGVQASAKPLADATHAVVVLAIYLVVLVTAMSVLVRRRDVN